MDAQGGCSSTTETRLICPIKADNKHKLMEQTALDARKTECWLRDCSFELFYTFRKTSIAKILQPYIHYMIIKGKCHFQAVNKTLRST